MAEFIQIQWTCGSIEEARKVCRYLVQEKYVACANITPWVESLFLWNNQLDTVQETKVFLKTRAENYDAVKEVIMQNTSYDLPEILFMKIDGGNKEYLDWLEESIRTFAAK